LHAAVEKYSFYLPPNTFMMKNSKLSILLNRIKEQSEQVNHSNELINITPEAAYIIGGSGDSGCTNEGCRNGICNTTATCNNTCVNTICEASGPNTGCANGEC
jgi:hypothetical protein